VVRLDLVRLDLVRVHLVRVHLVRVHLVRVHLVRELVAVTQGARPRLVRLVCLLAGVGGLSAVGVTGVLSGGRIGSPWLTLGFFVALTAVVLFPLHLTHTGDSEAIRLEEAFFAPMVVLLPPMQTVAALGLATAVACIAHRRGFLKTCFNGGMIAAAAGLGVAVTNLVGVDDHVTGRTGVAVMVGGLVFCAFSAAAVSGVIALAQGVPFRPVLLEGASLRVATWIGSLSLGLLVLMGTADSFAALPVAVVPALGLQFAYKGALRQSRERQQADALYEAANRIRATVESDAVRAEVLRSARELLAAGESAVVPTSQAPADGSLRTPLDDDLAIEVAGRATGGTWTEGDKSRLQALAAVASGALANALLYEQMNAITRSLGEGVVAVDENGTVTFANPAADSLLGWRRGELVGREIAEAVDPDGRTVHPNGTPEWVHLPRLRAGETLRIDEHVVTRRDGTPLDVALTASPVVRDGEVVGAVLVFRDVRDRKALEKRLVHQAFHDPLTGLPNRSLFLDRLEHARARSARDGGTQAVLFIDVDRFKVINDSLGHRIGDQVLQTIASRIVGVLRPSDTVSRFGGDEFTVLLEEVVDAAEAGQAAERILRVLQLPVEAGGREVVVTVSIGVAVAEPGNAPGDLLAGADIAMYQAKGRGKNRYVVATADADERALARLDLEMELRRAISEGELEVHYQPVVHAHDNGLYGLEALVRWRHPSLGLLLPAHFMEVAEESGLVLPLGDWVLEQACIAGVQWQRDHPHTPIVMAVNLSARQFQQSDLCQRVAAILASTGLDSRLLALEITETAVMEDTAATLSTLRALKQLKVRLSIDDFGTGYSSLSYLKRFPVDAVKIDKMFIDGLSSGPVDREIVQAVIRLANAVGMQTIAEGVETTAQQEALRLLGCSLMQGFLHSRPGPLDSIRRTLDLRLPEPRVSTDESIRFR
jgi:diguanylate cyclase (GGDEF)-like protein/PAS domain S-box-containing protein